MPDYAPREDVSPGPGSPDPARRLVSDGTPPGSGGRGAGTLLVPFLIGGAVAVALGAYGQLHEPTLVAVNLAGFSGPLAAKTWLATGAVVLAIVQLVSALAMYAKLGITAPYWTGLLHRWSGRAAFLLSVPVAIHCLYAVGFQSYSPRVLIHSLLGCFFFGAFTAKMLILSRKGVPGWALPVFGGLVFTALVGIWLTSSLWFFTTFGVKL
jgi:hypothetical protein